MEYLYIYTGLPHKDVADTARQFNVTEAGSVPSRFCRQRASVRCARRDCARTFIAASDERVIDSIIRFTNSQNPIRPWDLNAQDKL